MNNIESKLPKIASYCNYSSDNYGAHSLNISLPGVELWFSYKTLVAFQVGSHPRVVRVNDWQCTTGKHLNAIDGGSTSAKKERVDGETFARMFEEQFTGVTIPV